MTVAELRANIGKFGMLSVVGEHGYNKVLPGWLKDMDTRGTIWYVDTEGYGYAYKASQVKSFEIKEFEPLPAKYNGQEVYSEGGRVYYRESKKEADLKK